MLPDVQIGWRDVVWGSAMTSVLFSIGKYAVGFYLQRTGVSTTYGAAGSLVLLLLWIYFSSLIFLLGAEFTRVHSRRYRDGRAPASLPSPRLARPRCTAPACLERWSPRRLWPICLPTIVAQSGSAVLALDQPGRVGYGPN